MISGEVKHKSSFFMKNGQVYLSEPQTNVLLTVINPRSLDEIEFQQDTDTSQCIWKTCFLLYSLSLCHFLNVKP